MSTRITFTPKVIAALAELRNGLAGEGFITLADLNDVRESFSTLDQAGIFEEVDRWERLNGWIPLPQGVVGTQIRHRKIVGNNVRLGGGEPKVIIAETVEWVVYAVFSGPGPDHSGRFIREIAVPRTQFEEEFERKE